MKTISSRRAGNLVAGLAICAAASLAGCIPAGVGPSPAPLIPTVVVNVVKSPTPLPPATNTPLAAAVATSTQVAATVTLAPTSTRQPTAAPSAATATTAPGAVPTQAATLAPCALSPGSVFRPRYTEENLQVRLGCAQAADRPLKTAYQAFQRGFMLWRDDTRRVYAFYNDGTWQDFPDTWAEGEPEYSCPNSQTPSTTPPTPRRGMGKVWCQQASVRDRLGNAQTDEIGNDRATEEFQNGFMVMLPERNSPLAAWRNPQTWK